MSRKKVFLTPAISVPKPEPTAEEREATRQAVLDHHRERVIKNAESACSTMEMFLQTARRRIAEAKADPNGRDFTGQYRFLRLPETVLHEMSWGVANASAGIEGAMSAAHDFLRLDK